MGVLDHSIEKVLFSERKIKKKVEELGKQISDDYSGKKLLLVGILKGSAMFMADLMRAIKVPCEIDFMVVSSYGSDTKTSGNVKIIKDLNIDIKGYDLLIVEDIIDSGNTISALKKLLNERNPESVKICTLFDKPSRRTANVKTDYYGAIVSDEFIVGYGLDYNEKFRNLPYVGVLKRECYEK